MIYRNHKLHFRVPSLQRKRMTRCTSKACLTAGNIFQLRKKLKLLPFNEDAFKTLGLIC